MKAFSIETVHICILMLVYRKFVVLIFSGTKLESKALGIGKKKFSSKHILAPKASTSPDNIFELTDTRELK